MKIRKKVKLSDKRKLWRHASLTVTDASLEEGKIMLHGKVIRESEVTRQFEMIRECEF